MRLGTHELDESVDPLRSACWISGLKFVAASDDHPLWGLSLEKPGDVE